MYMLHYAIMSEATTLNYCTFPSLLDTAACSLYGKQQGLRHLGVVSGPNYIEYFS